VLADGTTRCKTAPMWLIAAPWSIGLRPPSPGHEPGTWLAPRTLMAAGVESRLQPVETVELPHPPYRFSAQPGTRIRNGVTIREHSLLLADAVGRAVDAGAVPVVLGGDCSLILGCLLGARRGGRTGLLHVDGHADFVAHPGDDPGRLGAAAGMDLAFATGRGESLMTHWPDLDGPLVADDEVVQIGDREDTDETPFPRFAAPKVLEFGVAAVAQEAWGHLAANGVQRAWLHVDLDVLDQSVLAAVDSPGSPGLTFDQLVELVAALCRGGRCLGIDVTIYDPELDPDGAYLPDIVDTVTKVATTVAAQH
jgi:arginase